MKRADWLILGLALLAAGTLVHPYRAQQASRYALTAAVVERGTVTLDDYQGVLGIDKAVRAGHIYSDKAPGQALLAVPFFALGKAAGIEDATILRIDGNLGVWWVTFWSAAVPGAVLLLLMHRRVRSHSPPLALGVSLGLFFGTLLFPFSALLFGHVLAAALLYAAFVLITDDASNRRRLAAAGVLAGGAVVVEYTAILGVLVIAAFAIWRHRGAVLGLVAGGALPALALAWYNTVAFGSPFTLSYQFTAFSDTTDQARPVTHMFNSVSWDNLVSLVVEGRGLLIATPVIVVALVGALRRSSKRVDPEAVVGFVMFGLFLLLPIFWGNPWGGDSPGARYMTPALPFLAVPLARAWQRWRLVTLGAVMISVLTMTAATLTDPLLSRFETGGLGIWLSMLFRGETVDTLFTMALGGWGWLLHAVLVAGVVALLVKAARVEDLGGRSPDSTATRAAIDT